MELKRALRSLLFFITLTCVADAAAVELSGAPITVRFSPEQYRATPSLWSAAAATGKLYVASADGVLVYDGVEWATVPLPVGVDATFVRRLPDGQIMVGGNDTYGRLEHDALTGYRFVDLLASSGLPEEQRRIGPVWEIVQTPEGIYFQARNFLHLLPANGGATRSWPLGPDMRSVLPFGGDLYARFEDQGLGWLRDGKLQLLPDGGKFARVAVSSLVGWGGNRYVVAGNGVWRMEDSRITLAMAWPEAELPVYVTVPLDGGGFALSTLDGEVIVVDATLRITRRVKLSDQGVTDLTRDNEGGLWAVTDTEVFRLALPSPWSLIDRSQGIRGLVYDAVEYDDSLWVAGSRGLQRLTAESDGMVSAERLPWIALEAYGLLVDEHGLLIAHREGLSFLARGQSTPEVLIDSQSIVQPLPLRDRPDLVILNSELEVMLLRFARGTWTVAQRWPLNGMAITDTLETASGELWFADDRGAPQRWRLDLETGERLSLETFGPDLGLPIDGPDRPKLFFIDGELNAYSKGKTFRFAKETARFAEVPNPELISMLLQPGKLSVVETAMGLFAVTPRDLLHRPASTMDWQRVQISGWATTGYGMPRVSRGGVLRVPVWNGILQYAPDGPVAPVAPLAVEFEQLVIFDEGGDPRLGLVERGAMQLPSGQPIKMRFTLGTLEPGARFRYRMSNVMKDFSDWADRDLSIRGLDPGEYLFEVEGELPSGRAITPMRLRLLVMPRWFEEPLLRVIAVLALVLVVVAASRAIGRRRVRRVENQNRLLEQRIADRTLDLERANARLGEMAVEDPLTSVQNRRALEQGLSREWARCSERGHSLGALMIDVDHFKRFNDHHGHLEGDRVLIEVAALLRTELNQPVEMLARYGGEEFTLLMPGTTPDLAMRRAETLRDAVERARVGVTISVGVAVLWPDVREVPTTLIRLADQALYEAKRLGRNRVVNAGT